MTMTAACLRPEFTQQLLESLLHSENINLISPHGQGRRRTLQDLRSIAPQSWSFLQVDMRDVKKGDISLLDELVKQAKIENITSFDDFIDILDNNSNYCLIIIHNFNILTDLNVISCLNKIEKYTHVSLLCVSEEKQSGSALLAKDYLLPAVTSKQLLNEIKRRDLKLKYEDGKLLVAFLLQQSSPYSLLDEKPLSWFRNSLENVHDKCEGCADV